MNPQLEMMKIKQSSEFMVNVLWVWEEGGIVRYPTAVAVGYGMVCYPTYLGYCTMRDPTALGYRKLKGEIIIFRASFLVRIALQELCICDPFWSNC